MLIKRCILSSKGQKLLMLAALYYPAFLKYYNLVRFFNGG
jgi:hypothetical protein